jgi:hypothetical protein
VIELFLKGMVELTARGVLALVALAGLATAGAVCRWGWLLRWSLYLTWGFALLALAANRWKHGSTGMDLPSPGPEISAVGLVLAFAAALVLLVRHYRGR